MGGIAAKIREKKELELIGSCVESGYPLAECEEAVKNAKKEIKARAQKAAEKKPATEEPELGAEGGFGLRFGFGPRIRLLPKDKGSKDEFALEGKVQPSDPAKKEDDELRAFLRIVRCWGRRFLGDEPACELPPEKEARLVPKPGDGLGFSIEDWIRIRPKMPKMPEAPRCPSPFDPPDFVLPERLWPWMPRNEKPERAPEPKFTLPFIPRDPGRLMPWHGIPPRGEKPECEPEPEFTLPFIPLDPGIFMPRHDVTPRGEKPECEPKPDLINPLPLENPYMLLRAMGLPEGDPS